MAERALHSTSTRQVPLDQIQPKALIGLLLLRQQMVAQKWRCRRKQCVKRKFGGCGNWARPSCLLSKISPTSTPRPRTLRPILRLCQRGANILESLPFRGSIAYRLLNKLLRNTVFTKPSLRDLGSLSSLSSVSFSLHRAAVCKPFL